MDAASIMDLAERAAEIADSPWGEGRVTYTHVLFQWISLGRGTTKRDHWVNVGRYTSRAGAERKAAKLPQGYVRGCGTMGSSFIVEVVS